MRANFVNANIALKKWRVNTFWERFWNRVSRTGHNGCWIWIPSEKRSSYGFVGREGKVCLAHRVSYESIHGPIPDGLDCCHECDNPPCINPEHLFVGTRSENIRDAMAKGRFILPQRTQISKEVINEIRRAFPIYKMHHGGIAELQKILGLSYSTIYKVAHGKYQHTKF